MMHNTNEIKVWDPAVRLFHWLLVGGFFIAYFAEDEWMSFHIWAGYLVAGLLGFRLVWGVIGSRHARFADFVYRPSTVLSYVRAVLTLNARRYVGHNPAGGAMIVALLVCSLFTAVSGMALYGADAWLGPLAWLMKNTGETGIEVLEEAHEFAANLTVLLVVLHVFGVIWESVLHHENLVKAMVTGRKRDEHQTVNE